MKFKQILMATLMVLGIGGTAFAADAFLHSAPAVQGYDVVSYQNAKRPVRGNGNFTATHEGATYLFSSAANKEAFEKDPNKYVPAYNGFCALGVSVGKKFIGDPEVWRVVDGRLFLNLDTQIQATWLKDVPGRIQSGDEFWTTIKDKDPATL